MQALEFSPAHFSWIGWIDKIAGTQQGDSLQFTVYSLQLTFYSSSQFIVYSIQFTVHYTIYGVYCALFSENCVQCFECKDYSVLCGF